jgi:hypothetical protein
MIRAFLSFVEEDLNVVNLFRGQAKNDNTDLEFADYSIKDPFDSRNADYIARGITDQLTRKNHSGSNGEAGNASDGL